MSPAPATLRLAVVRENVPLGTMTTYKSGGPARYLVDIPTHEALLEMSLSGFIGDQPVLVLGRGSNLVVADAGFPGVVVKLGKGFSEIKFADDAGEVRTGAAVTMPLLARALVEEERTGLEFLVGIPGSVGGGVRQNAGCFGEEIRDHLIEATLIDLGDGRALHAAPGDLEMSYRHSSVTATQVVTEATFSVAPGDPDRTREELKEITRWRKEHQPGGTFNAGSVFKNPPGETAGELIDGLGLKGLRVGDVSVSEKHANFFVAGASSTSADILALVEAVKDRVFESTGTMLEPEIQFVGFEK